MNMQDSKYSNLLHKLYLHYFKTDIFETDICNLSELIFLFIFPIIDNISLN